MTIENKKQERKVMSAPKTKAPVKDVKQPAKKDDKAELAKEVQKKMMEKAEEGCPFC
jgi:hypothetical protein